MKRKVSTARRGATLTISFDGQPLGAVPGETVAATLIAHRQLSQSSDKSGNPRGLYCGMGVCHDCLVTINGGLSYRACMTKVADGMRVERQAAGKVSIAPEALDLAPLRTATAPIRQIDVLVVGAGPGGLCAAIAARRAGLDVLVLDERPSPGGQFYKQPVVPGAARAGRGPDAQARAGRVLIDAVIEAGVVVESATLVWGAARTADGRIEVETFAETVAARVEARILIVATGAYERPVLVPGWTLPGVMTTGAGQTLLRSYGVTPGQKVVVAGNGPLNFQVAAELLAAGSDVTVVEAAPPPWQRPRQGAGLLLADPRLALGGLATIGAIRRGGGRLLFRHRLVRVEGRGQAQTAVVAPLAADGKPDEPANRLEVDAVLTGDGFWPASELPRLLGCRTDPLRPDEIERGDDGATSLADVFVVGEAGGFGGAHIAMAQGRLAGAAAARRLGADMAPVEAGARRRLTHHRRFQHKLWQLFAAPEADLALADGDTTICRCEGLSLDSLRQTIACHEVADVATLKRLSRAGMGRCQGRYCAARLRTLVDPANRAAVASPAGLAPQMPLRPVPVMALAAEKPEWGGHQRSLLPEGSVRAADPLPVEATDILVIGAGIVGLSTALFLARAGAGVLVFDQAYPNAGASGGNAGSLHAQLLSFDHGEKAEGDGGAAARTLPLQIESIGLWQALATELGTDLELKITGGVMVAETEADLRFLAAKTAVERAQGVECEVITAADLRRLEPALDDRFIGAAYCPLEGKINPLLATEAVRRAAQAAGARIVPGAQVVELERTGAGFRVVTPRGAITASRVVNAAGAYAARIGRLLDVEVPVFGAPLQMVVTEAVEPQVGGLVAHASRHLTLKQAGNGNFILGGAWTAGLDPVHGHPRPLPASLEGNLWVAQHVLPALRKINVIRSWAALNINIDGAPIIGEDPRVPGLFNAVTSNGYTLGPLMGRITADLIVAGRTERDLRPFSVARFQDRSRRSTP
jgi:glycine/D-amino acid oxidase-like deaminating enzyme